MEKIQSFTVDHLKLKRGIYVSRKDSIEDNTITTFDIRMKEPNNEPVINTGELHAIEHIGATYLRNHKEYCDNTIYFGPMGCRTGFYLILRGDLKSSDVATIIINMFEYIRDFEGNVPGADPKSCGNYLDMNLPMAKYEAKKYLDEVLYSLEFKNLNYPK